MENKRINKQEVKKIREKYFQIKFCNIDDLIWILGMAQFGVGESSHYPKDLDRFKQIIQTIEEINKIDLRKEGFEIDD